MSPMTAKAALIGCQFVFKKKRKSPTTAMSHLITPPGWAIEHLVRGDVYDSRHISGRKTEACRRNQFSIEEGGFLGEKMVLMRGIEPPTPSLPRTCSTPELHQRHLRFRPSKAGRPEEAHLLPQRFRRCKPICIA